jgi:hypothetical protein
MLSAWVAALFLASAAVERGESPFNRTEIRIRLYNYAEAPHRVLQAAKQHASRLLEETGLRVLWVECRQREDEPPIDAACELPRTALDLELRVVNREMAKRLGSHRHRLGYAWMTPDLDSIAAAYFHRAVEFEHDHGIDRATILGGIMAHELGHLLLDISGHAPSGLMRRLWERGDLLRIAQGTLWFTPPEAARIRELVRKRAESCRAGPGG